MPGNGTSGALVVQLDRHEGADERQREGDQAERLPRGPAGVGRVDQRVDEDREAGRDRDRAGDVEVAGALVAALGQQARRQRGGGQADRHVDEQDPFPAGPLGQHPAEQHADGAARPGHGAPDAQRLVALSTLGEDHGDHRQRGRREQRGAEALDGAGDDQLRLGLREPARQRGEREEDQAGQEEPAAAEQIGHSTAEQQEAAEGQRVRVDDPREVLLGEAQIAADRRQRDVDDRGVEDDDELRGGEQGRARAIASLVRAWCSCGVPQESGGKRKWSSSSDCRRYGIDVPLVKGYIHIHATGRLSRGEAAARRRAPQPREGADRRARRLRRRGP